MLVDRRRRQSTSIVNVDRQSTSVVDVSSVVSSNAGNVDDAGNVDI
jgi:hypothetical protein